MTLKKFSDLTGTQQSNFVRRLAWCTPFLDALWKIALCDIDPVLEGGVNSLFLSVSDFELVYRHVLRQVATRIANRKK